MATITVTHQGGQAYLVRTRQHSVLVDQPAADGAELGPTPVELLVGSLAACAAHYAVGYLRDNGLAHEGLRVDCRWTVRQEPTRVGRVVLSVHPPTELDDGQRAGLLAAVDRCTVHNSLRQPPDVAVLLGRTERRPSDHPPEEVDTMNEVERQRVNREAKATAVTAAAHHDRGLLRYLAAQGYATQPVDGESATPAPERQPARPGATGTG